MEVDRGALARGALVAAVIAVPAAIVGRLVAPDDGGLNLASGVLLAVTLIGLAVGGAVAAHQQRVGAPLTHGILAAASVYLVVQVVLVLRRLVSDDDIRWDLVVSNLVWSVIVGAIGGAIGGRLAPRSKSLT
jgi:hypothetical protein